MKHLFGYFVYLAFVMALVVALAFPEFNPRPITGVYIVPPSFYRTVKIVFVVCVVFFGAWYVIPLVKEDIHRLRGRIARAAYRFYARPGSIVRISPISGHDRCWIEIQLDPAVSGPDDLLEFQIRRCEDGSVKKSIGTITISPGYVSRETTSAIKKKGPWSMGIEIECVSGREDEIEVTAIVELVGIRASLPTEISQEYAGKGGTQQL